jgi:hypothetical protein
MEEWIELYGKEIMIIFEDGENHFSRKQGILHSVNQTHLILFINNKIEGINLSKIIRFEEVMK